MAFGLMGGSQQAQGHTQVLVDMIDLGANPQAASDAARFTHGQASNVLALESNLYDLEHQIVKRNYVRRTKPTLPLLPFAKHTDGACVGRYSVNIDV